MADLAAFPDVVILLRAALLDLCPNIAPQTPPDPDASLSWLPMLTVEVIGGTDDRVTDTPSVVIDAFASTRADAYDLAEAVRQRFLSGPLAVAGKGVIDAAATTSRPQYVAYVDNPPPFRFTATYRVDQRRK